MELLIDLKKENQVELVLTGENREKQATISSSRLLADLFLELDQLLPGSKKEEIEEVKVKSVEGASKMSFRIARALQEGFLVGP